MEIIGYEGTVNPDCPLTWGATAIRDGDEIINGVLGTRSNAKRTLEECEHCICILPHPIVIPEVYGLIVPLYDDLTKQVVLQVEIGEAGKDGIDYVTVYDDEGEEPHTYVLAKDKEALDPWIAKACQKLDEAVETLTRAHDILDHRRSTANLLKKLRKVTVQAVPSAGGKGESRENDWVEFRNLRVQGVKARLGKEYTLTIDPGDDE